jgi:hypothetical protein
MIISALVHTIGIRDTMKKLFLILSLCILFTTSYSVFLYAYPDGWSDDVRISSNPDFYHTDPDIDVDAHYNVWITWQRGFYMDCEVFFSKRDSLGNCRIPPTNVSNNTSNSIYPKIAVDPISAIQFIWRDQSPEGYGVWHAKIDTGGVVLVPPHLAITGSGSMVSSCVPEMVLDRQAALSAIWDELIGSNNQMNYSELDSIGNPVISKFRVSHDNCSNLWPGMGGDTLGNMHLGYRSDTSGAPYRFAYTKISSDTNMVIDNMIIGQGSSPTFVADRSQNIHVVYGCQLQICYLKLDQEGNILVGPDTISMPETHNNICHLALDSLQYLHVVWTGNGMNWNNVQYAKLDTLGNWVVPPMEIVGQPYVQYAGYPRIAVDANNRLHVTWLDTRFGGNDVMYKRGDNESSIDETNRTPLNNQAVSVVPNPFTHYAKIAFALPLSNKYRVYLAIYDAIGRKVYTQAFTKSATTHLWDGTDNNGHILPAGVYFVRIEAGAENIVKLVVKLK